MSQDPNAGASPGGGEMTISCLHCGADTPLNSTACINCGNPLDSVDPQWAVSSSSEGGGWTKVLTGIGCAILVVVAAGAAFFVGCAMIFRF